MNYQNKIWNPFFFFHPFIKNTKSLINLRSQTAYEKSPKIFMPTQRRRRRKKLVFEISLLVFLMKNFRFHLCTLAAPPSAFFCWSPTQLRKKPFGNNKALQNWATPHFNHIRYDTIYCGGESRTIAFVYGKFSLEICMMRSKKLKSPPSCSQYPINVNHKQIECFSFVF